MWHDLQRPVSPFNYSAEFNHDVPVDGWDDEDNGNSGRDGM